MHQCAVGNLIQIVSLLKVAYCGNTISKMVDTREDLPLVSLLDMVFKILLMTSPGQDKIWMAGLDLGLVDRLEDTVLTAFLPLRE